MSFNDDNLERFKYLIKLRPVNDIKVDPTCMIVNTEELMALIARLEAAEKVCKYADPFEPCSVEDEAEYDLAMSTWLKTKGVANDNEQSAGRVEE